MPQRHHCLLLIFLFLPRTYPYESIACRRPCTHEARWTSFLLIPIQCRQQGSAAVLEQPCGSPSGPPHFQARMADRTVMGRLNRRLRTSLNLSVASLRATLMRLASRAAATPTPQPLHAPAIGISTNAISPLSPTALAQSCRQSCPVLACSPAEASPQPTHQRFIPGRKPHPARPVPTTTLPAIDASASRRSDVFSARSSRLDSAGSCRAKGCLCAIGSQQRKKADHPEARCTTRLVGKYAMALRPGLPAPARKILLFSTLVDERSKTCTNTICLFLDCSPLLWNASHGSLIDESLGVERICGSDPCATHHTAQT